jgi:hypothetical protein
MRADDSANRPLIADHASALGIRPGIDLPVEAGDLVKPGTGGMSVSPTIVDLPNHKVPKSLRAIYPSARGSDDMICWVLEGTNWGDVKINDELSLRCDRPTHGMIEPRIDMDLGIYRNALAATQSIWKTIPWS